jgi:hypothetical protein
MTFERLGEGTLDYAPCHYGNSKLLFRGPRCDMSRDYVAFLGSTETYGKFIESPFPELFAEQAGIGALNLGSVNAGVDAFHDDPTIVELCRGAQACVIQVMGAHKLSNRFYTVHTRRNDRFLYATDDLRSLYPEVDFAEIHFTRHLLSVLLSICPRRFEEIRDELSEVWVTRMAELIKRIGRPTALLWLSSRRPCEPADTPDGSDPIFVTQDMLDRLGPPVTRLIEVPIPPRASDADPEGMIFSEFEVAMARELPGQSTHAAVAELLRQALRLH